MQTGSVAATKEGYDARALVMDLLALLGFSAAVVVTRGILKTHMGIPGHSAVLWVPVLVLAGTRRSGMSFGSALMGGTIGMAFCGIRGMEFAGLMATASAVEAFGLGQTTHARGLRMLLAGILGHFGKLGVKLLALGVAGMPLNRAGLPLLPTLALYAAFGLIGGAIAVGILAGWTRLRSKETSEINSTTE